MVGIVIAVVVKLIAMLVLSVPHSGITLPTCSDSDDNRVPCFQIEDGHERIALHFDPYSYVNLS